MTVRAQSTDAHGLAEQAGSPYLPVGLLGAALLWVVAAAAAGDLVRSVGLRADYNEIFWRPQYVVYYLANAAAFCWLGFALVHQGVFRSRAPLLATVLAVALELIYPIAGWVPRLQELFSPAAWTLLDILWLPGRSLEWLFKGSELCRWCDGLVDAPVRIVLLHAGTAGCLNGLGWYWLATGAVYLRRALR